jgi:hypothetical protein
MAKLCSCCSMPAQYSLALLLSTVGISKRIQKCSPVVLLYARLTRKRTLGPKRAVQCFQLRVYSD